MLDPKFIEVIAGPPAGGGGPGVIDLLDPNAAATAFYGTNDILELSGGNIAVVDAADDFAAFTAGAVYLFNGTTGALIATLTGASNNDNIGNLGLEEDIDVGDLAIDGDHYDLADFDDFGGFDGFEGDVGGSDFLGDDDFGDFGGFDDFDF